MKTMEPTMPRVAAIHDLAGFGRCSLSVILPLLSVMGVQACPVPTAVLSAHTGGLGDVRIKDLSDYLEDSLAHYGELDLNFDCIYTGFLNSPGQVDSCLSWADRYPDAFLVVDPVMGDNGKAYRTVTKELQDRMKELAKKADLITPNLTEGCILLNEPYPETQLSTQEAKSMLVRLAELGPEMVVITSAPLYGGGKVNIAYDRPRGSFWQVKSETVPGGYPGTGDMFAAILVGGLLRGDSLPIAMERSTRFLELAIKTTYGYGTDTRYGVLFEKVIPFLTEERMFSGYERL